MAIEQENKFVLFDGSKRPNWKAWIWSRSWLFFLFSLPSWKKREEEKENFKVKYCDQKSCLSAWSSQKRDLLFVRKPDETVAEDKSKDVEDNTKDEKEPKENIDEAEVELIYIIRNEVIFKLIH